ncbi:hypothetical protein [Flavobacterium sp.]|uniref:anti-sigma factor family protein n=1 Tax=Flavobacterium sp. TaxID=239 RepID=UPI0039E2CC5B
MKNNHLTDETLQAFLLNEIQDDAAAIHMAECAVCSARLKNYQYLIERIDQMAPESFPFDVTTVVMHQIELQQRRKNSQQDLIFWGVMGIAAAIIVLLGLPFIAPVASIFYTKSLLVNSFILGTALCVTVFFVADLYKRYDNKEKALFDNHLQPMP